MKDKTIKKSLDQPSLKSLILTLLLIVFVLAAFSNTKNNIQHEVSRKDELQLEGFINDYFYRRQIKDSNEFNNFEAYGSVLLRSIVIYVYPKVALPSGYWDINKEIIKEGLHDTLLDFPDFEWTKEYSFSVIVR